MSDSDSSQSRNLPAVIVPDVTPMPTGESPEAGFVAQLLAAKGRLPLQRSRWRAEPSAAVGAYDLSRTMAARRMPQGYRRTVVV